LQIDHPQIRVGWGFRKQYARVGADRLFQCWRKLLPPVGWLAQSGFNPRALQKRLCKFAS
jgi:hypothetical protein